MENKTVENLLKKHKLSVTQVRKNVLQLFMQSQAALSKADIEARYPEELDRITLFRTIKKFQEKGVIHQATDGTDVIKYAVCQDACTDGHHHHDHVHFHCIECNNTFCVEEENKTKITLPSGFIPTSQEIIVKGKCAKCA